MFDLTAHIHLEISYQTVDPGGEAGPLQGIDRPGQLQCFTQFRQVGTSDGNRHTILIGKDLDGAAKEQQNSHQHNEREFPKDHRQLPEARMSGLKAR